MSNTAGNPLSAGSLALFMATSLPAGVSPQIKSQYDALALAVHAGMIAIGFRLIGLGEDDRIEARSDAHNPRSLPEQWNASNLYAFRYAHDQSAMEYLVKVSRLGSKAVVFAVGLGDDKTASFEVVARDYVSETSVPATPFSRPDTTIDEASRIIQDIFISDGRLSDLGSLFKVSILHKLAPSLHKEGYEESSREANDGLLRPADPGAPAHNPLREDPQPHPAYPRPFAGPFAAPPDRPFPGDEFPPPGFGDPYEIGRPPRGMPERTPLRSYGESDLYPAGLGPHDPAAWNGIGGGIRGGPTGGMHPTFDDPLFVRDSRPDGGYDSRAPPGARYDSVNPGDPLRDPMRGRSFPGGGAFGSSAPSNPFSGFGYGDYA